MTVENKSFIKYAAKLIILYLLLDYGTTLFIGITTQGGIYIEWLDKYFNYVAWLRHSILSTAKFVMYLLGYETHIHSTYILQIKNSRVTQIVTQLLLTIDVPSIPTVVINKLDLPSSEHTHSKLPSPLPISKAY